VKNKSANSHKFSHRRGRSNQTNKPVESSRLDEGNEPAESNKPVECNKGGPQCQALPSHMAEEVCVIYELQEMERIFGVGKFAGENWKEGLQVVGQRGCGFLKDMEYFSNRST
jgi:hypothetical protein